MNMLWTSGLSMVHHVTQWGGEGGEFLSQADPHVPTVICGWRACGLDYWIVPCIVVRGTGGLCSCFHLDFYWSYLLSRLPEQPGP